MLTVSTDFKDAMQSPAKDVKGYLELASGTLITADDNLTSFTVKATGEVLSTSMKQIDIVLLGEYSLIGEQLTAYYGVKIDGTYEYKSLGKFNVLTAEYSEDADTTKLTAYDNMVLFQREYTAVSDFPTTLYGFAQSLSAGAGVNLVNTELYNGALEMTEDYWIDIPDTTYRDVLKQICEVTGCNARVNSGGDLELIPLDNPSGETLTYDNLLKYKQSATWGGVNTVTLSRQPQNDDIYQQDEVDTRFPMNRNILDLEVFNVNYTQGA